MTAYAPVLHGAVGIWDEVLNAIPLVIGAAVLLYLFYAARRRRREQDQAEEPKSKKEGRP